MNDSQTLSHVQQVAIARQAAIGLLQTIILALMLAQVVFAGVLRALPPEARQSVAFLHRIEWGVYAQIALIAAQVAVGWAAGVVLTNRLYLLALRLGKMRTLTGNAARRAQILYALLALLLVAASLWVRARGFLVQPTG